MLIYNTKLALTQSALALIAQSPHQVEDPASSYVLLVSHTDDPHTLLLSSISLVLCNCWAFQKHENVLYRCHHRLEKLICHGETHVACTCIGA